MQEPMTKGRLTNDDFIESLDRIEKTVGFDYPSACLEVIKICRGLLAENSRLKIWRSIVDEQPEPGAEIIGVKNSKAYAGVFEWFSLGGINTPYIRISRDDAKHFTHWQPLPPLQKEQSV